MTRNRLYLLLGAALCGGYAWLAWQLTRPMHYAFTPCIFKHATGIACPSCGTTRSLEHIVQGHMGQAALTNPIGYIVAAIMLVAPFWLLYDVAFKKNTLYHNYKQTEATLKKPHIALPLIGLVLLNWAWNIYKGL